MNPVSLTNALAASAAPGGRAAPEGTKSLLGQNDFLKIMIAQLQAQNPLEPGNSNEFLSQLAQLTTVEQTTNLANASELSSAVGLIGRAVTYTGAAGSPESGVVESVQANASGTTVTVHGTAGVKLSAITEVQ